MTGYGIVGLHNGKPVRLAAGVLRLGTGSLEARLGRLHLGLTQIVAEHQPTACAVEGVFQHRNARTALILGHARGVCLLAAGLHSLDVVEYPPATVKLAITGHGAADKQRVALMVARLLNTAPEESEDASDALALALCYLESRRPLRVFE
jgi:crossover junction endodeoxyribonuclease RuvC